MGSAYEFHRIKSKQFGTIPRGSQPTDDSIMTLSNMLWLSLPDKPSLS